MGKELSMKQKIMDYVEHYKILWTEMADRGSAISSSTEGKTFYARHHSFARSDNLEKYWYSEYTDEMYDSVFDCLTCYRWYVIPERLRVVSGLREETDLELLLDSAGYSASFIAEELFCMIDMCLESGCCTENDLHRIRQAYNGLSGYQDDYVSRIVHWGTHHKIMYPDMNAAGISSPVMSGMRNPFQEGYYSGYIPKPSNNYSAASVTGVFAV